MQFRNIISYLANGQKNSVKGDFAARIRDFLQDLYRVRLGFLDQRDAENAVYGKRSIQIINKITLGLFLRLLIEQDGILLV